MFRRAVRGAGLLATLAVLLTALVMAGFGMLLGLPLQLALLIGAVVSSTDAAAVFSILRNSGVRLERGTAATLEVESGLNDPMALFLTIVATEIALGTRRGLRGLRSCCSSVQFVVGVRGGWAIGFGGRAILRVVRLPAGGLYPVLTVALAFLAFGVTTLLERERLPRRLSRRDRARRRADPVQGRHPPRARRARLAGPDPDVRDARSAGLPVAAAARHAARARARGRARLRGAAARRVRRAGSPAHAVARAGLRRLGRPARRGADRARHLSGAARRSGGRSDLPSRLLRRAREQPDPRSDRGLARAQARARRRHPAGSYRQHRAASRCASSPASSAGTWSRPPPPSPRPACGTSRCRRAAW